MRRLIGSIAALALGAALIAGCGSDSPASLVGSAQDFINKGDYKSAEIQLKTALQKDPALAEGRFLLGTVMMQLGDYESAEKELRRALEYNHSPDLVYPKLARSMFRQGNVDLTRKGIGEFRDLKLSDAAAQAALLSEIGYAYLGLGQADDARTVFDAALAAKPDDPRARIGAARLKAADGDIDAVAKVVDEVLAATPGLVEALSLKAEIQMARGETDAAVATLREVVKAEPLNSGARTAIASLLIGARKFDEAAAEIAAMRKALPRDLRALYLQAVLEFRRGEPAKAREAIQLVLKSAPNHPPSLLLAGAVEYQLGQFSTAEEYLRKVVTRFPSHLYARSILALTYLRLGQPAKADETIKPALARAAKNAYFLRTAGEVALANNDPKRATELYERAVALDKDNAGARVRLGVARLSTGDSDGAMRDLEAAAALEPESTQADLGIIAAHLSRKEFDKAIAAADAMAKKPKGGAVGENMKGLIYSARGDRKSARESFERALERQYDFLPAAANLARMDVAEKRPEAARKRFEDIVAKNPKNEPALLALADMQLATGAPPKDVAVTVERAVNANPGSANARLYQVSILLRANNPKAALTAAQSAAAALPDNAAVIEILGRAQLAAGEPNQAVATFNRLGTMVPHSAVPLLLVARAHLATRDVEPAMQALRKALDLQPDRLNVHREAISAYIAAGKPEEALVDARALQKARPREAVGFVLEGEVHAAQKKFTEAANAYGEALKRQQAPVYALRMNGLLKQAGKTKEADAVLARWIREHPKDVLVRLYLADSALSRKDYAGSVPMYKQILADHPNNVVVLNNMAWALSRLKDPSALQVAEKAYRLAPQNPAVADTLGVILVDQGDMKRGLQLLGQAVKAAPDVPDLRLHYAQALLKSGDKAAARRELEQAANAVADSPAKAEAEALLKQL